MAQMLYQGHGSYRLTADDGTCVYVDPFAGDGYDAPADVIVVTHEHFDHTACDLMPHAPGCEVLRSAGLHPAADVYLSTTSHGIRFTAVQACNANHPIEECMGCIIEIDGVSFYAAGDTSMTDDMRSGKLAALGLDYAVLPADGIFNMDVDEAGECARLIDAQCTIPVHLMGVHGPDDARDPAHLFDMEKAQALKARGKLILKPGEKIKL